jgi:hypothetical protein
VKSDKEVDERYKGVNESDKRGEKDSVEIG